jgi:hypothetical protein
MIVELLHQFASDLAAEKTAKPVQPLVFNESLIDLDSLDRPQAQEFVIWTDSSSFEECETGLLMR